MESKHTRAIVRRADYGWEFVEKYKDSIGNSLTSVLGEHWYNAIKENITSLYREVADRRMRYEVIGVASDPLCFDDILENIIYNSAPDGFWAADEDGVKNIFKRVADGIGPAKVVDYMLSLQRELEQLNALVFTQEYEREGKLSDVYAEDMQNLRHRRKMEEIEKEKIFQEEYGIV